MLSMLMSKKVEHFAILLYPRAFGKGSLRARLGGVCRCTVRMPETLLFICGVLQRETVEGDDLNEEGSIANGSQTRYFGVVRGYLFTALIIFLTQSAFSIFQVGA